MRYEPKDMHHKRRLSKPGLGWKKLGVIHCLILVSLIVAPFLSHAANEQPSTFKIGKAAILTKLVDAAGGNEASPTGPVVIAGGIVRGALVLIGLVFLILTVYGGSLYLTASGNEEQVKKAKSIIVRAIIGMFIVIFAGAITQFLTSQIGETGAPAGDACPRGASYPAERVGIDYGCREPGYTLTLPSTCECSQ